MKIAVYAISKNEEQFVERFCASAKDADVITSVLIEQARLAVEKDPDNERLQKNLEFVSTIGASCAA